MYKIVRRYFNGYKKRTIAKGLTLEEAQAHCRNPETSSSTDRKSTRLNSSHSQQSRMPSSA